jgi:hypothetical protein
VSWKRLCRATIRLIATAVAVRATRYREGEAGLKPSLRRSVSGSNHPDVRRRIEGQANAASNRAASNHRKGAQTEASNIDARNRLQHAEHVPIWLQRNFCAAQLQPECVCSLHVRKITNEIREVNRPHGSMLRSTFLKMLGAQNVTHTLQPNEANAKSSSVDVSLRAIHAGFQSFLPGKRFSKDKSCLNK